MPLRSMFRLAVDYLAYLAVRLLVCIVEALPMERCTRMCRGLAHLFCDVVPIRRAVLDDNLRHAFPELDERGLRDLRFAMWEHLFVMFVEIVHARRKIHETNWRDYFELVGRRRDHPRGVRRSAGSVPVQPLWQLRALGLRAGIVGHSHLDRRPTARQRVSRSLRHPISRADGAAIIAKERQLGPDRRDPGTNGILAILGDQHAGPRGCWVDFFGRPASSHKAIALFALSSDATVVFCYTRRMGGPLQLRMGSGGWFDTRTIPPEMRTVPGIIGWYTRILENTIRQAPEQYWWVHRRWKDNRPRRGSVAHEKAA